MSMAPIETRYAGCRFRSRLEARWAVFFDHFDIAWEYEKEGYEIGAIAGRPKRWYLPDFYLPGSETWCEVKGDALHLDYELIADAVDWHGGLPGTDASVGSTRGLLLLGPIPRIYPSSGFWCPAHPIVQHYKGGSVNVAMFLNGGLSVITCRTHPDFDSSYNSQGDHDSGLEGVAEVEKLFDGQTGRATGTPQRALTAYVAARSARFEHGESGAAR